MRVISKPLSAPQGQYRSIVCSDGINGNHLYGCQPFYAKRIQWLKLAKVHCLQILLMCLGELEWINVRESDLRPTGWKE